MTDGGTGDRGQLQLTKSVEMKLVMTFSAKVRGYLYDDSVPIRGGRGYGSDEVGWTVR